MNRFLARLKASLQHQLLPLPKAFPGDAKVPQVVLQVHILTENWSPTGRLRCHAGVVEHEIGLEVLQDALEMMEDRREVLRVLRALGQRHV